MPFPSRQRVREMVADPVARRGFDLEDVQVNVAGKRSVVRILVDADDGADLDAIAELSSELSESLDSSGEFTEVPYTLEVTTPGIDRPLTLARHWQRAQGRKVRAQVGETTVEARIGAVADGTVNLVTNTRGKLAVQAVALADITDAVVQVEFARPSAAELELAGGVARGRPVPGSPPIDIEAAEDTKGAPS